jgi:hypothetical protein
MAMAAAAVVAGTAAAADFTVATNGSDRAAGTAEAPFATLSRARDAARALRKTEPGRASPVVVEIREGVYTLQEPLAFCPPDAGSPEAPLVFAAAAGARPVISAGVRITGWKADADGVWRATVPGTARRGWSFSQFFVNGRRRLRPAFPENGYFVPEANLPGDTNKRESRKGFVYARGDIQPSWRHFRDVEVSLIWAWQYARAHVASVDAGKREAVLSLNADRLFNHPNRTDLYYRLVNIREELRRPGQWYHDRETGEIAYLPEQGENPDQAETIASRLENAVVIRGEKGKQHVSDITFRGLTFAWSDWSIGTNGYWDSQGAAELPAAIQADYADRIRLENCAVRNTGGTAVRFGLGCRDCAAEGCEMTDVGGSGVASGAFWKGASDKDNETTGTVVRQCLIGWYGRDQPGAVGILIGGANRCLIAHNTIHDGYYSGISVGWTWAAHPSFTHDNTVEWNHIYGYAPGVLSDGGGVYTLGLQPGTVIRYNRVHGAVAARYGFHGFYFDQGSSCLTLSNNLAYDTDSGIVLPNGDKSGNLIANNIFADGRDQQFYAEDRTADCKFGTNRIERNLFAWREANRGGNTGAPNRYASNLWWLVDAPERIRTAFNGKAFAEWAETDTGAVFADPQFRNADMGDFTLSPRSPALALGFMPFDLADAGRTLPLVFSGDQPFPGETFPVAPPDQHQKISTCFEEFPAGAAEFSPSGWHTEGRNPSNLLVSVTEENAAAGRRALKMVNDKSIGPTPALRSWGRRLTGRHIHQFDAYLEPGATLAYSVLDANVPRRRYAVETTLLRVNGQGDLAGADGKTRMRIPSGTWFHVEMRVSLGLSACGAYDLRVSLPQGEKRLMTAIPLPRALRQIDGFRFAAGGQDKAAAYLDNLDVGTGRPR